MFQQDPIEKQDNVTSIVRNAAYDAFTFPVDADKYDVVPLLMYKSIEHKKLILCPVHGRIQNSTEQFD